MPGLRVHEADIARHYEVLHKIGCLGDGPEAGFLRAAYSDEETAAMKYIERCAVALGAKSRWDAVKNLILEWPGTNGAFVEAGSHLDTVPFGGNYDGAGGVVAGLAAIESIVKSGVRRQAGLRLRVWRGEEFSTFNALYIGSLSAVGRFGAKSLSNVFRGTSLEAAMKSQGADPEISRRGERTISQDEIDSILAHIELHIEQGNLLERQKIDIGVVTSIRAPRRYRVTVTGEFDHSGATPMGPEYRKDANLTAAYMLTRLDELGRKKLADGADLVQTAGVLNSNRDFNETEPRVYENAVPKVSGFCYFSLDIRSNSAAFLDGYAAEAQRLLESTAQEFGTGVKIELTGKSDPLERMSDPIQHELHGAAKALGISAVSMASGAGHDTAILGAERRKDGSPVPVGMVFIPCRGGKSHCAEEFTTYESIAKGASVMAAAMAKISG